MKLKDLKIGDIIVYNVNVLLQLKASGIQGHKITKIKSSSVLADVTLLSIPLYPRQWSEIPWDVTSENYIKLDELMNNYPEYFI